MPIVLWTSRNIAEELGITPRMVQVLAKKMGVGLLLGRAYVFVEQDLEQMRNRPRPGKPRQPKAPE